MADEDGFLKAITELRKTNTKRKFDQTIDLIVNLKDFDVRREAFSLFVQTPHMVKKRKVAGFFEKKSKFIDSFVKEEFPNFKEKKDLKKLVANYDFFVANAKLMPSVATTFGRTLGPAGKMPSPQLGILVSEEENVINDAIKKINQTAKIKVKEPSIKVPIGLESLKDDEIVKNCVAVYHKLIETLPRKKDNVRNVKIKFTMSSPVLVEI
jgi:large subunit ribosomal protein L1